MVFQKALPLQRSNSTSGMKTAAFLQPFLCQRGKLFGRNRVREMETSSRVSLVGLDQRVVRPFFNLKSMSEKEKVSVPAQESGTNLVNDLKNEFGNLKDVRRYLCNAYDALEDIHIGLFPDDYQISSVANSLSTLNKIANFIELQL